MLPRNPTKIDIETILVQNSRRSIITRRLNYNRYDYTRTYTEGDRETDTHPDTDRHTHTDTYIFYAPSESEEPRHNRCTVEIIHAAICGNDNRI